MKKDIKFNVFYGTEDFVKLFENLIEDKIRNVTENIKNGYYQKSDKYYSSAQQEVEANE